MASLCHVPISVMGGWGHVIGNCMERKDSFLKEEECCYQKKIARHAVQAKLIDVHCEFGISVMS